MFRKLVCIVVIGCVLSLSMGLAAPSPALASTTLYVDPSGAGGAYTTIQSALDAAQAGDQVLISSGTYQEQLVMSGSGTVNDRITITAEGTVTLYGNIKITGSYVTVNGLNLLGERPDSTYVSGGGVKVQGDHVHVTQMDIRNFNSVAIYFDKTSSHGYAADNYIFNSASGFRVTSHAIIERNEIDSLNLHGNHEAPGDYFRVFGSNIIIRDNYGHGTVKGPHMGPAHVDFFQSWDNDEIEVKNVLIENNTFTSWAHQGLMLENDEHGASGIYYISDWTVRNNIFAGYESWGISAGKAGGGIPNMLVENNTFVARDLAEGGGYFGVMFVGSGGSGTVRNNILMNHTDKSSGALSGATMDADYNLYYDTVIPSSPGANSIINADPLFYDVESFDFRLNSSSPAIDSGVARSGYDYDRVGEPRPAGIGWDMGAYEHQSMIRLYAEDFEDGVADDWDAVSGTWDITATAASNKVYNAHSTDALARSVVGGHIWDDYEVKATVQVDGWGSTTYRTVGLLARYNDSDNYYLLAYEAPGELRIKKKQAGTITTLASIPFTLNEDTEYTFNAVVDGDNLSFYVNGAQQLTAQDSGIATGKAGLISVYGESYYDDFSVISTDPTLLLMDDFEVGEAAAWDANSGSWSVVQDGTKVYQGLNTHYANNTTTGDLNWQDYTLQFGMKVDSWGTSSSPHAGMMARYTDSNNYYMFGYKNGELIIQRRHGGTNSAIAKKTFTLSPSSWYTFQAVLQGSALKLYVNGAEELSVNDANLVSGKIGIHTRYADASFDEVIIRE